MKGKLYLLLASLALYACSNIETTGSLDIDDSPVTETPAVPGVMYVKFDSEPESLQAGQYTLTPAFETGGRFEARHRAAGLHLWYMATFDPELPLTKASVDLSSLPGVNYVEKVPQMARRREFNDPFWSRQWSFYNTGKTEPGAYYPSLVGSDINVTKAWDITTGTPDVIVAVCDGGVDFDHEDLHQNMWVNPAELNGKPGVDDDGNGYVDDIYGASFILDSKQNAPAVLPDDHGTHVAGVIAAVNNNGKGISGIAGGDGTPETGVRIMTVMTAAPEGREEEFPYWKPSAAFVYAADNGAVVMNCSWGFPDAEETPKIVLDGIKYFNEYAGFDENGVQTGPMAGGLCIFAAGNSSSTREYPAVEDCVLAVSSIGANFKAAYYTNFGDWVDIAAPGGDAREGYVIYSTVAGSKYAGMQGTSMAAPHVTGVAALAISKYKGTGFTRQNLIDLLVKTANPVIYDYQITSLGSGLVDAYAALTAGVSVPEKVEVTDVTPLAAALSVTFSKSKDVVGNYPAYYMVYYSESGLDSLDPLNPADGVSSIRIDSKREESEVLVNISGLKFNTEYHVRIVAFNVMGQPSVPSDEIIRKTKSNTKPLIKPEGDTDLVLRSADRVLMRFDVSDPDDQELTISITEGLEGAVLNVTGGDVVVIINALQAQDGKTYKGVLSVNDGFDTSEQPFSYQILPNTAPYISGDMPGVLISERNGSASVDLSRYIKDDDKDNLRYEIDTDAANITYSVSGNVLTLLAGSYGTGRVSIKASDPRGKSVSTGFDVVVRDGTKEVDLYPNPVVDMLNIRTGDAQTVDVKVFSKTGAEVASAAGQKVDAFNPLSLDLRGVPAGEYSVKVTGSSKSGSYTIIKR